MPVITYNLGIPDAPNNPSDDQPLMKTNTNSINQWNDVDHYTFSNSNAGKHKQVQMPVGILPVGLVPSEGTLYTKTANSESALFYTPDASGNEYRMTRTVTASFATFGIATNGWTFLPGGLLLKYGVIPNVTGTFSSFSPPGPAYTNAPSCIVLTVETTSTSTDSGALWKNASTTAFDLRLTNSTGNRDVSYIVIGL